MEATSIDHFFLEIGQQFEADRLAFSRLKYLLEKYPETSPQETWEIIPMLFWQQVITEDSLRSMPYADFLKTPYWAAVAWKAKTSRPWCALCCEPLAEPLETHHRTYAHLGDEWRHMDDLTVLCRECHEWTSKKMSLTVLDKRVSL